jgi:hypothetical protein
LWQQFQQAARVAHAGQFDRFHGAAGILRHCGQGGGLLLLLRDELAEGGQLGVATAWGPRRTAIIMTTGENRRRK